MNMAGLVEAHKGKCYHETHSTPLETTKNRVQHFGADSSLRIATLNIQRSKSFEYKETQACSFCHDNSYAARERSVCVAARRGVHFEHQVQQAALVLPAPDQCGS